MAELPFGPGSVIVADGDGTVVRVRHPERPAMGWLLDEATEDWHTSEQRWGKGFVITADGAATAAFIMPSCVGGRRAHVADPVATDQDWPLYMSALLD